MKEPPTMKFKVGDRVRSNKLFKNHWPDKESSGTVTKIKDELNFYIRSYDAKGEIIRLCGVDFYELDETPSEIFQNLLK